MTEEACTAAHIPAALIGGGSYDPSQQKPLLATALPATDANASASSRATPIVVQVDRDSFHIAEADAGAGAVVTAVGCMTLLRLRRDGSHLRQKGDRQ